MSWSLVAGSLLNFDHVVSILVGEGGDGVWRLTVRTIRFDVSLTAEYATQAEAQAAARDLVRDAVVED